MSWTHVEDKQRKARKRHQCFICAEPIEPNETYMIRFGYEDGEGPISTKMHLECERYTDKWDDMDWKSHSPGDGPGRAEIRELVNPPAGRSPARASRGRPKAGDG